MVMPHGIFYFLEIGIADRVYYRATNYSPRISNHWKIDVHKGSIAWYICAKP